MTTMHSKLVYILLINLSSYYIVNCSKTIYPGHRIFTSVLFRHGERSILDPYPNDPWRHPKYWPFGFGQLTNVGKQQAFELGQYLRNRYIDLIKDGFPADLIYMRSSNTDRTIMTALAVLAGLFPPDAKIEKWNENLMWQPVPIHTIPKHLDHLLAFKRDCPKYQQLLQEYVDSDERKQSYKKYRYLFNYLSQMSGRTIDSFTAVRNLYSVLSIETLHNRSLPIWTSSVYPGGDMEQLVTLSETVRSKTREMSRLRGGFLLKYMVDHMEDKFKDNMKINGTIWLYSGHDTTITTLLTALKMFEHHIVPFAACVMMELWIYDNTPFVEIYYKNSSREALHLIIPNCGRSCPLTKFIQLYDDVLPGDFDIECKVGISLAYIAGPIMLGMMIVGLIIFLFYRRIFHRKMYRISKCFYKRLDFNKEKNADVC